MVLDVNKKCGPWLVKSERLYEAMNTLDTVARKKRGLAVDRVRVRPRDAGGIEPLGLATSEDRDVAASKSTDPPG